MNLYGGEILKKYLIPKTGELGAWTIFLENRKQE